MAAAIAIAPTKTPVGTAMVGAQTTLINQINAAAAMATEMETMTVTTGTMKTKVTAGAAAAWR